MSIDRTQHSPLTPLLQKLEQVRALDPVVEAVQPLMRALTANPALRGALQGRWLSHALHPLVIEVPMGTWLSAFALDATGVDDEGRAAQLLTAIGLAAAPLAALTGWAELAEGGRREKRVGVVHATANGVGIALQAATLVARGRGNRAATLALAGAAMSVIGGAGLLGGHLAVAREMGTKDPAFDAPEPAA